MYIQPNSVVKLLRNVPLDTTYNHTLYFTSKEAQANYFAGQTKYSFSNVSYSRVTKGAIRLEITADQIYDCNYMMFQNTSYGNRWFYAFITDVEYINDVTSQVNFVLDVMQTWHFDYTLKQCFVEREHAANDSIGANLIPENIPYGDIVCVDNPVHGETFSIVVMYNEAKIELNPPGATKLPPYLYTGVYQGLSFLAFPMNNTTIENLGKTLESIELATQDGIVSIFMCPSWQIPAPNLSVTLASKSIVEPTEAFSRYTGDFDGYKPKNNKLYTFPYNFIQATNYRGDQKQFKYEYFKDPSSINFVKEGNFSSQPSTIMYPAMYKNYPPTSQIDLRLTIPNYPVCSWSVSNFVDWLATSYISDANNLQLSGLSAGLSILGGGGGATSLVGGILGGLSGAGDSLQRMFDALTGQGKDVPNGSTSGSLLAGNHRACGFGVYRMRIRGEFAKIIDEYFTMYGYATNRVKVPNRSARPHWNYVKTSGCVVTGSVPADDMRSICEKYDRGITFWKRGSEVGNYSLSNK